MPAAADPNCLRVLTFVDDCTRECRGQIVDFSISGERLARFLDDLGERHGLPEEIVLDNGPELTSKAMFLWSERTGVKLRFIEPGQHGRTPHHDATAPPRKAADAGRLPSKRVQPD